MAFDWTEFIRLADALTARPVEGCAEEASQRAAISRAYYGLVISARNAVEAAGGNAGRGSAAMHGMVAQYLQAHTDANVRALGLALKDMRSLRNQADYDDAIDATACLVQQMAFVRLAEPHIGTI